MLYTPDQSILACDGTHFASAVFLYCRELLLCTCGCVGLVVQLAGCSAVVKLERIMLLTLFFSV
jgi:hypothetical protein